MTIPPGLPKLRAENKVRRGFGCALNWLGSTENCGGRTCDMSSLRVMTTERLKSAVSQPPRQFVKVEEGGVWAERSMICNQGGGKLGATCTGNRSAARTVSL